jgi:preprotein translocase SecE subunit
LYKYGQGYWVRVLSAVLGGMVALATGAWLFQQLSAVSLPMRAWSVAVEGLTGPAPSAGQQVRLEYDTQAPGSTPEFKGVGTVETYQPSTPTTGQALIGRIDLAAGVRDPADANLIRIGEGAGSTTASLTQAVGVPVFELLYLQAGVVAAVLVIGAILVYWLVGRKPQSVDFLIATDGEMKKVNWSTRKEIVGSTWVVIAASVLIALFVFGWDFVFSSFMRAIEVLPGN